MARRRFHHSLFLLILFLNAAFFIGTLNAQTSHRTNATMVDLDRNQEIRDLQTASAPRFLKALAPESERQGNTILFTFSENDLISAPSFTNNTRKTTIVPEKNVNRVSIAFSHEGWSILHPLTIATADGKYRKTPVFFLYFTIDRETQAQLMASGKVLEYRYIVDGVWMADPNNHNNMRKINGALVSMLNFDQAPPPATISPEINPPRKISSSRLVNVSPEEATMAALSSNRQARTVILRWVGEVGAEVYVAGSFNHFDPYMSPLAPTGTDPRHPDRQVYAIELRLLAGQYYYHFVINGEIQLDALNTRHGFNAEGISYSQLQVP